MNRFLAGVVMMLAVSQAVADCPAYLNHDLRVLHKQESANLCQRYAGKPLLVVNTASHCGFTPQFKGLEALHKTYAARGLAVAGFPSDDFRQEANEEGETAKVCYINYGVTFDMYAPVHVRGDDAHPLFAELARQSSAPQWNFNKYVIDRNGKVVAKFGSMTSPDDADLRKAIESVLR